MPLLTAESFDLADRETLHTDTRQSLFDLVEFERFDDRLNLLHKSPLGRCSNWPRGLMPARASVPNNHSPKAEKVQDPPLSRARRDGSAGRLLAEESLPGVIGVAILTHLSNLVTVEADVEVVAIVVFPAVGRGGVRLRLHG